MRKFLMSNLTVVFISGIQTETKAISINKANIVASNQALELFEYMEQKTTEQYNVKAFKIINIMKL